MKFTSTFTQFIKFELMLMKNSFFFDLTSITSIKPNQKHIINTIRPIRSMLAFCVYSVRPVWLSCCVKDTPFEFYYGHSFNRSKLCRMSACLSQCYFSFTPSSECRYKNLFSKFTFVFSKKKKTTYINWFLQFSMKWMISWSVLYARG